MNGINVTTRELPAHLAGWQLPNDWSWGSTGVTGEYRHAQEVVDALGRSLALVTAPNPDHYAWLGEEGTRPFAEWQMTYSLRRAGLPVPAPIAARYHRRGLTYTGEIITERLATVGSLAECLRTGALSILTWIGIGRCIRRFHDFGVCHADLNAHNILLAEDQVYLIDFDRCQLRGGGLWRDANLVRLRRSLEKIAWGLPPERFGEADWHGLLDGYRQAPAGAEPPPA